MPELPEVESVARTLWDGTPSLNDQTIIKATIPLLKVIQQPDHLRFAAEIEQCCFINLNRIGKYLLFGIESAKGIRHTLVIHLRMTGRLFLVPEHEAHQQHTRLILHLHSGLALRFDDPRGFGRVWLVDDPAKVIGSLGPDGLTISYEQFTKQLAGSKRQLKPLLLDQSLIAGIGNIYADEILFRSQLHPLIPVSSLSEEQRQRLHSTIVSVLQEAVAMQGANIDGVFKAGKFQVAVYGRNGSPCPLCGDIIIKIKVAQRGTHVCPTCQHPTS